MVFQLFLNVANSTLANKKQTNMMYIQYTIEKFKY